VTATLEVEEPRTKRGGVEIDSYRGWRIYEFPSGIHVAQFCSRNTSEVLSAVSMPLIRRAIYGWWQCEEKQTR
jgi:hypothetical protein